MCVAAEFSVPPNVKASSTSLTLHLTNTLSMILVLASFEFNLFCFRWYSNSPLVVREYDRDSLSSLDSVFSIRSLGLNIESIDCPTLVAGQPLRRRSPHLGYSRVNKENKTTWVQPGSYRLEMEILCFIKITEYFIQWTKLTSVCSCMFSRFYCIT